MARYVDGFVIPVPRRNLAAYRRMARKAAAIWRDHGALELRECVVEDATPGCGLPFPRLAACRRGETVVFSWIVYRSRAHRDRVNAKVLADPRMGRLVPDGRMPFDPDRMAWGGFEILVDA